MMSGYCKEPFFSFFGKIFARFYQMNYFRDLYRQNQIINKINTTL